MGPPPGGPDSPGAGSAWMPPADRDAERHDPPPRIHATIADPPRPPASRPGIDPSRRPSRFLGRPLGRAIARVGRWLVTFNAHRPPEVTNRVGPKTADPDPGKTEVSGSRPPCRIGWSLIGSAFRPQKPRFSPCLSELL